MKRDIAAVRKMVKDTLSADFESVRIIEVEVTDDFDSDGDEVLRIDVVFEGRPRDLDARVMSGAVRQLRPKLEKMHELAFPLLSFISQADARRRRVAAG